MEPLPGVNGQSKNLLQAIGRANQQLGAPTAQEHKARRPRPIGRPPEPLANQGEEGETNTPDQERLANQYLYLVNRARRPMVQNLHMAAKTNGPDLNCFTEAL